MIRNLIRKVMGRKEEQKAERKLNEKKEKNEKQLKNFASFI